MKIKVHKLSGYQLDLAVAIAAGILYKVGGSGTVYLFTASGNPYEFMPSTKWAHGGQIVENEGISLSFSKQQRNWSAHVGDATVSGYHYDKEPLTAAMRCYVESKLGEEIDIPKELL